PADLIRLLRWGQEIEPERRRRSYLRTRGTDRIGARLRWFLARGELPQARDQAFDGIPAPRFRGLKQGVDPGIDVPVPNGVQTAVARKQVLRERVDLDTG